MQSETVAETTTSPSPSEPNPLMSALLTALPPAENDLSLAPPQLVQERLWHLLVHGEQLAAQIAVVADQTDDPKAAMAGGMLQAVAPMAFGMLKQAVQSVPSEQQVSYLIFLRRMLTGVLQPDWPEVAFHDAIDHMIEAEMYRGQVPALAGPDPLAGAADHGGAVAVQAESSTR